MQLQSIAPEPISWLRQNNNRNQDIKLEDVDISEHQDNVCSDSINSNCNVNTENHSNNNNNNNSSNENENILFNYNEDDDYVESFVPITCYSILIALGGLIFGYDIGTIGGIVDLPSFISTYGNENRDNKMIFTPIVKGSIISISSLGGFVSGLIAVSIIPIIGMRFTIFIAMIINIIGNLIIIMSNKWELILVGRSLIGICIGLITITCPMYISEISPVKYRGLFTCFNQLFTTIGILIGALTLLYSSSNYYDNDLSQFQYPLIQGIVLSTISCLTIWIVPESPNWLVKNNKPINKVKKSISKIRNLSIENENVINSTVKLFDFNFQANNNNNNNCNNHHHNNNSILKGKPKYLQRTLTGIFLLGFQQFTGINYFFYYGISIFEDVKLTTPYLVPVIFGSVNLIFSIFSIYIINKFKRKTLLIIGSVLLINFLSLFTIIKISKYNNIWITIILILLSCLFISVFAITWGPIASVLISEFYPINIKVKSMSICGSCGWIFNFIISLMIPILSQKIGYSVGFIFIGFLNLSILFVYYLVPETKNISTVKLDKIYETKKSKFGIVLQN